MTASDETPLTQEEYARIFTSISLPEWFNPQGLDVTVALWHIMHEAARDAIDELLPHASDPEVAEQIHLLRRYQRSRERLL